MKPEEMIQLEALVYKAVDGVLSQAEQRQLNDRLKHPEQLKHYQTLIRTYAALAKPVHKQGHGRIWMTVTTAAAMVAICLCVHWMLDSTPTTRVVPTPSEVQSSIFNDHYVNVLCQASRHEHNIPSHTKQERPTKRLMNRIKQLKANPITL